MDYSALIGLAFSLAGEARAGKLSADQQRMLEAVYAELRDIPLPELEKIVATQLGPTAGEGVYSDPEQRQQQMEVMGELRNLFENGGFNIEDRAALSEVMNRSNVTGSAQRNALAGEFAQRGQLGAGARLALGNMNAQGSANRSSQAAQDIAARGEARRQGALSQYGDMAGRLRTQDFSEGSARAAAKDSADRWNAGAREKANHYNAGLPQQQFTNRVTKATGQQASGNNLAAFFGNEAQGTRNQYANYGAAAATAFGGGGKGDGGNGKGGPISYGADGEPVYSDPDEWKTRGADTDMTMRETMDEIDEDELQSLKAGSMPAAYRDPGAPEMTLPNDDVSPDVSPEWGLDVATASEPDDSSAGLKTMPTGDATPAPKAPVSPFAEPKPDEEYTLALRKIRDHLSKPAPDYSQGLADAQAQDASENKTNRILAFLSAGLRRAPTPSFMPAATNASGFMQSAQLKRQGDEGQLSRLGALARLAKPAKAAGAGKDPGNVEGLRSYLVKVGAASAEELAGMSEGQLKAVMTGFGLKARLDESGNDNTRADAQFAETKRHNQETEGAAWAAANRAENEKPLSPGTIDNLADFDVADRELAQLEKDFNDLGMSGLPAKISGKVTEAVGLTGTDAAVYLNKAQQAQQVVGKILEGGKLAAGDEKKYRGLIPQPGDSQQLLKSKVSGLRRFLGDMKAGRIKLYREGGYKTPGAGGEEKTGNDGKQYRKNANGRWESVGG